ncbi:MAG TPA: DUF992 domain-containing protein [Roseiarcus sp.]|nr:DUF992 domain-containing protein [Roseiarcus sp.]
MSRYFRLFGAASALMGSLAIGLVSAQAQSGIKTGSLLCRVSGGIGYLIGSRKAIRCRFTGENGHVEHYDGHITKVGLDIGATTGGTIVWAVFEPTAQHGSLGGSYAGVSAQATFGAGLGANALIGGSNNSVALQPFSIEGQTGLNLAAGVGGIDLVRVR